MSSLLMKWLPIVLGCLLMGCLPIILGCLLMGSLLMECPPTTTHWMSTHGGCLLMGSLLMNGGKSALIVIENQYVEI
ncbi:hypothetical protein CEXT_707761 [Caerostris extrusa]|uniref:NADH dehydrogenase subunit 4 n=1 Tax=Caerostris extrusa TaxID=172846 RepID=A0AAV4P822_CAEEX|nr:hypothetical protein CEXT_707761 [Caerostris extrusa]